MADKKKSMGELARETRATRAAVSGAGLNRYGDRKECAPLLGVGLTTFLDLSKRSDFPKPFKLGRISRWNMAEVMAWAKAKAASGETVRASMKEAA